MRKLSAALLAGDAAAALQEVESGAADGVQLGEWVEQTLEFFRDLMVLAVDAKAPLVSVPNRLRPELKKMLAARTADDLLEIMDLLAACRMRMRASTFGRTLLEMTVVRICGLDRFLRIDAAMFQGPAAGALPALGTIPAAIPAPTSGAPAPSSPAKTEPEREKKNPVASNGSHNGAAATNGNGAASPPPLPGGPIFTDPIGPETVAAYWELLLARLTDQVLLGMLRGAEAVACLKPSEVTVTFPATIHQSCTEYCERCLPVLEQAARDLCGRAVPLRFRAGEASAKSATLGESDVQLRALAMKEPLVRRAEELLGAKLIQVDRVARKPAATPEVAEAGEQATTTDATETEET
ncbi:MAG TPA: hypothetical protein VNC50_22570 [Planctomycetia bacterium]|nr:hypothetical protein [Planctomycetia bacterium]